MSRPKKKIVENRIYELEQNKPYFCLAGEEWTISDIPSDRLHFHNLMEVGYCLSDSGTLIFNDSEEVHFQKGDIFLIPRFIAHTTYSSKGCRSHWNYLYIDPDMLSRGQLAHMPNQSDKINTLVGSYQKFTAAETPRLHFLCRCMLEEALHDTSEEWPIFVMYANLLTEELRRTFHSKAQENLPNHGVFSLKHALEYIDDHYMEPCNTSKLASLCHLSETHFRRLFLSSMHTTPVKYVLQMRIRQACVLLKMTKDPITSIGQQVGINSISSFNRNFHEIMGISPQQYRNSSSQNVLAFKGWLRPDI